MTERDQFETWAKTCGYKLDKFTDNSSRQWYVDKKTAAAFDGWQASRRAALDEAAGIVDAEAENARQEHYYPGVVGAFEECAAAIRALASGDAHE